MGRIGAVQPIVNTHLRPGCDVPGAATDRFDTWEHARCLLAAGGVREFDNECLAEVERRRICTPRFHCPPAPPSLPIFPRTDARKTKLARGAPAPIQYGPRRSRTLSALASRRSDVLGPFLFLSLHENRASISPFVHSLCVAPLFPQSLKVAPKTGTVPVRAPFRPKSAAGPLVHQVAELRRLATKNFCPRDMSHGITEYLWG